MSIIYSYPEQGALNANDMLIGTSAEKVGGKQKNITRNFSVQQIADFINGGAGFIDPVASDFQIAVFNQAGKKITGSIMSQDAFPNGTGITISGNLTTTGNITTPLNLTANGVVSLGGQANLISLNSVTKLGGPIQDATGTLGSVNQILLSNGSGVVTWQNYEAGLTYEGTWDASTNTPTLTSGQGVSGHFYIVSAAGNTNLDGNNDWNVGDWAVFFDVGGAGTAAWQKIDNTSVLTGTGTDNKIAMWTGGATPSVTLTDSLISQDAGATKIQVAGGIDTTGIIQSSTTNANLQIQGNGTGGVEVMSADSVTDGKITLNCSQNSHGVTLQSPAHGSGATYTLILPTSFGGAGDVLTSAGANPSQLVWTTPTTGTVTNFTTVSTAIPGITTAVTNPTTTPELTLSITGTPGATLFLDGTGNWSSPGGGVTDIIATAPLNASAATGSVTLSMPAYATATGGYVPSGGATGEYLDGLSGNWTSLPVSGVTSVTSANTNTLTVATATTTPVITAVTAGGVGTGNDNLTTGDQVQSAIDTALAGTLAFKGTFNAATGAISSPGSGQLYTGSTGGIAVTKGDFYIADTSGSFYGTTAMNVGDEAIALNTVAAGFSSVSDWSVVPSAGAGVVSVLPSSAGLVSSGQPLVITPAGGTGTVTIESTAYAGQSNVGHVPAGGSAGQYLDGDAGSWLTLPASGVTSVSQGTPFTSTGLPLLISPASGSVVISSAVYGGGSNIGIVPDGGTSADFLKGDGTWGSAGGGASTITTNNFSGNGTVGPFTLGATPSGGSTSFVDVFIDGVYQEISTYTVSGTALSFVTGSEPPTGTNIQTKTTSGNVSGALVSSVDIGQSSGNTGAVNLRIVPLEVTSGQTISGNANSLYIFTATTGGSIATVTLPGSPTLGDSIKISNLGGLANELGANGNKIMGVAADMTINTPTAAFELIWSGSNNGWIIIGNV
jgi:hypothetical protein